MHSKDGFSWTAAQGLQDGLPTIGFVEPPVCINKPDEVYDAIVVGSGYAGLVASRDLATQGKNTLLVEARDRLGGRTWHATLDGFNYEMGGTWIHWHMPHIYREVSLYGLQDDWLVTQHPGGKEAYTTLTSHGGQRNLAKDEEDDMVGRAWHMFCNVDGDDLQHSWKYAFGTHQSPALLAAWDTLSCRDRLEQIRRRLSVEEAGALESFLQQMGGAALEDMGFLNALHWWILGSHQPAGLNAIALHTRPARGHSDLHRRLFAHARSTGHLSYSFQTPVARIEESPTDGLVTVTLRDGTAYTARAVIVTVPLNVLSSIAFHPPVSPEKQAAFAQGSVNKCNKVHIDLAGPDWLSWNAMAAPGKGLIAAIADGLTPAQDTHIVTFGPDPAASNGMKLGNIDTIKEAVKHMLPDDKADKVVMKRIVYHDWNADEFAKGTWCYLPKNFLTKYLAELQRPHGHVLFASADFSDGWRGWIDGAVQAGMQAAKQVIDSQAKQ